MLATHTHTHTQSWNRSTERLHSLYSMWWVILFRKILRSADSLVTGEGVRIGYRRSIHQRFSHSKQGWVMTHHFVSNSVRESSASSKEMVSQYKMSSNFGLSASTEQNIVKRSRQSGEISQCEGDKPLLDELGALRHASTISTATWAQEELGKPFFYSTQSTAASRNVT